tara:strand:- start:197 stop:418 length:222 start_codon:yes stop_codon:yes gene_type:complete
MLMIIDALKRLVSLSVSKNMLVKHNGQKEAVQGQKGEDVAHRCWAIEAQLWVKYLWTMQSLDHTVNSDLTKIL